LTDSLTICLTLRSLPSPTPTHPHKKTKNHSSQPPNFEFHNPSGPIYTSPRFLPPAKVVDSALTDAIISHGAYLNKCTVEHSIIGLRSRIAEGVHITDSMVMGADFYESDQQRAELESVGRVPIGIGAGTVLKNVIADKNARIGANVKIIGGQIEEGDTKANKEKGFVIKNGIVVVMRNATIPEGTVIGA
jgi:glucose-1-phosphate adenylyltransferase